MSDRSCFFINNIDSLFIIIYGMLKVCYMVHLYLQHLELGYIKILLYGSLVTGQLRIIGLLDKLSSS